MHTKHEWCPVDASELRSVQGGGLFSDIVRAVGQVVDYVRQRFSPHPRT